MSPFSDTPSRQFVARDENNARGSLQALYSIMWYFLRTITDNLIYELKSRDMTSYICMRKLYLTVIYCYWKREREKKTEHFTFPLRSYSSFSRPIRIARRPLYKDSLPTIITHVTVIRYINNYI